MQVRVLAFLLFGVVCGVIGQEDDCTPENADDADLAVSGIFRRETLEASTGISVDEVMKALEDSSTPELDAMREQLTALRSEMQADPDQAVMEASRSLTGPTAAASALIASVDSYYNPVCPKRYYWLSQGHWFFYNYYNGGYQYCWAYYPMWTAACHRRYCAWWFTNPYLSYYYYRCFPVYKVVYLWASCFTYTTDSSGNPTFTWYNNRYIRHYLPRDCSCRRYLNPYITAATCDVTPQ